MRVTSDSDKPAAVVRLGRALTALGAFGVALGVVVGLSLLALGNGELALRVLLLAPIGMIVAFTGIVGTLFGDSSIPQRGPEDG